MNRTTTNGATCSTYGNYPIKFLIFIWSGNIRSDGGYRHIALPEQRNTFWVLRGVAYEPMSYIEPTFKKEKGYETSDFVGLYFQGKYNKKLILNSITIPLFSQVFSNFKAIKSSVAKGLGHIVV